MVEKREKNNCNTNLKIPSRIFTVALVFGLHYIFGGAKMEKEPRVNQSSIRYSNSVAKIVNTASGNTFSDKFESICLNFEKIRKLELFVLKSWIRKLQ